MSGRRLTALLLATALAASACGAAPPELGPQGVDQLTIPTPDPEPSDFVEVVDNPWLPLAPGTVWEYDVTGDPEVVRVTARVEGTRRLAGVATTGLVREEYDADGTRVGEQTSWLAQDRDGNVWVFAADGTEAGLAMPATPRRGDGFASGEEIATVVTVDRAEGVVELELRDDADRIRRTTYRRGEGPVREERRD